VTGRWLLVSLSNNKINKSSLQWPMLCISLQTKCTVLLAVLQQREVNTGLWVRPLTLSLSTQDYNRPLSLVDNLSSCYCITNWNTRTSPYIRYRNWNWRQMSICKLTDDPPSTWTRQTQWSGDFWEYNSSSACQEITSQIRNPTQHTASRSCHVLDEYNPHL
jgi:hypothetical protein